jgi:hypothetical protein
MGKPVGSLWLQEHFNLSQLQLTHKSYIGSKESLELDIDGTIEQVFGPKYAPTEDTPIPHLEFSLKYDDLNLEFLKAVFTKLDAKLLAKYIAAQPYGKYGRKAGFLYEFLMGEALEIPVTITGNYTDLLEEERYVTGSTRKNIRWRINDNLLGVPQFCPVIRKTPTLQKLLEKDLKKQVDELKDHYPENLFHRATRFLYTKETKSSYEIEREKPSPIRMQKFIALLTQAGQQAQAEILTEKSLTKLQNTIVDERFAAMGFRDFQNYIGQSLPGYEELIHYICPPPAYLHSLMGGLKEVATKTTSIQPAVSACLVAFGFVFIHPFEDGNGRLHRFLIHDILTRTGVVEEGMIIPVSAHMLNNIKEYDHVLEQYSKPLMKRIRYTKKDNGEIEVTNPEAVEAYFRYPDLTAQCLYLARTIQETISQDMPQELDFIQHYDEVKSELQNIVDMPDKDLDLMILFLHQNNGIFPKRRRKQFERLTEDEIQQMEIIFREIFNIPNK